MPARFGLYYEGLAAVLSLHVGFSDLPGVPAWKDFVAVGFPRKRAGLALTRVSFGLDFYVKILSSCTTRLY